MDFLFGSFSPRRATSRSIRVPAYPVLMLGCVASALLVACGSPHPTASSGQANPSIPKGSPATTTTVSAAVVVPFNKYKNARLDVSLDGPCTNEPRGTWVLKGMVINPDPVNPTGFSIVVDFVRSPGGTVLDTQVVIVPPVAPKHTVSWKASWRYDGGGIACLVRQAEVS